MCADGCATVRIGDYGGYSFKNGLINFVLDMLSLSCLCRSEIDKSYKV